MVSQNLTLFFTFLFGTIFFIMPSTSLAWTSLGQLDAINLAPTSSPDPNCSHRLNYYTPAEGVLTEQLIGQIPLTYAGVFVTSIVFSTYAYRGILDYEDIRGLSIFTPQLESALKLLRRVDLKILSTRIIVEGHKFRPGGLPSETLTSFKATLRIVFTRGKNKEEIKNFSIDPRSLIFEEECVTPSS